METYLYEQNHKAKLALNGITNVWDIDFNTAHKPDTPSMHL